MEWELGDVTLPTVPEVVSMCMVLWDCPQEEGCLCKFCSKSNGFRGNVFATVADPLTDCHRIAGPVGVRADNCCTSRAAVHFETFMLVVSAQGPQLKRS